MADVIMRAVPFDSNEIIDPSTGQLSYDRVAYSRDYADWWRTYFSNGVLVKGGQIMTTELQVVTGEGLNSIVKKGSVSINGRTGWLEDDIELLHSLGTSQPRIDRVVVELNIPDDREIKIRVLEGEPSDSPIPPELIQTEDVYQMSLAQVTVPANSAVLGDIIDERDDDSVCGISQVLIGVQPPLRPLGDSANNIKVTDETALLYDHVNTPEEPLTADEALNNLAISKSVSLYLVFVGNANTDMLDAAFGKNNEEDIQGLGRALSMYIKFKGEDTDISQLKACYRFEDIPNNPEAKFQMMQSDNLVALMTTSPYIVETYLLEVLSDSVSNAGGNATTKNVSVTVTQDMIDGKEFMLINHTTSGSGGGPGSYKDALLNGVTVPAGFNRINLQDHNITTAGTYTLQLRAFSNASSKTYKSLATVYTF